MNPYEKAISARINRYERIKSIDFLRGFCVLLMIFDHIMYDLRFVAPYLWGYNSTSIRLSSLANEYWASDLRMYGWLCAVGCFVFLCGFSTGLSRSNLLRGFRLAVIAAMVTVVTRGMELVINMHGVTINFGVLHTLSFCILCYALCAEGAKRFTLFKLPGRAYNLCDVFVLALFACTAVLTVTHSINPYYYRPEYMFDSLADMNMEQFFTYALGFHKTLASSDYIPILPWLAVFMTGAFAAPSVYRRRRYSDKKQKSDLITLIGKHSLIVYIVHQPVIYAIMYIIGVIFTGRIILI